MLYGFASADSDIYTNVQSSCALKNTDNKFTFSLFTLKKAFPKILEAHF